jgi:uncharacterized membrane protein
VTHQPLSLVYAGRREGDMVAAPRPSVSPRNSASGSTSGRPPVVASKNIQDVIALERETRRERTVLERMTDLVTAAASSTGFIVFHILLFALWIGLNALLPRGFDPYPFNLLTLVVSLEAIVLTGFVLMSQSRMTHLADKRAHLDLQVNLLAEQELTAILKVVCLVAEKTGVDVNRSDSRLGQLLDKTDITALADELTQELAAVDESAGTPSASQPASSGVDAASSTATT